MEEEAGPVSGGGLGRSEGRQLKGITIITAVIYANLDPILAKKVPENKIEL